MKRSTLKPVSLGASLLDAWRRNNEIDLLLISRIPQAGFAAVPLNSRGRTVAEQLDHMRLDVQLTAGYEQLVRASCGRQTANGS